MVRQHFTDEATVSILQANPAQKETVVLTWHRSGHGPTLDAGADGTSSLTGERLDFDVIGCIRL